MRLNLYLIVLLISFFPLLLWIAAENKTKLKKLFIWTTKSGGPQHCKHTNCTWLFISNCNSSSDILDWTIISDCKNSFNNRLKNYDQAKNFFYPANTQSSSEESFKEKRKTFVGMCSLFTWFNMQMLNLCHR